MFGSFVVMGFNPPLEVLQAESRYRHREKAAYILLQSQNNRKARLEMSHMEKVLRADVWAEKRKVTPKRNVEVLKVMPDLMAEMLAAKKTHKQKWEEQIAAFAAHCKKIAPITPPQTTGQTIIPAAAKEVAPKIAAKSKDMSHTTVKPCHVPKPVDRLIRRVPEIEKPPEKIQRSPAVYDNHKSSYGIYAEMQREMAKKSG